MANTVVQHLDLDADSATESLRYRYNYDARGRHVLPARTRDGVHMTAGMRVTFDTYFNAFYENYWYEKTALDRGALRLWLSGRGVVSLYRKAKEGEVYVVHREAFESRAAEMVEIPFSQDTGYSFSPGRLWFDIDCYDESELYGGEWCTPCLPQREVHTSVVFCTFNRQQYLARIVQSLADHKDVYSEIDKVYIVNQGVPFTENDLEVDDHDVFERIEIIHQPNMGGCGGFTRGMYETLHNDDLTHFILLDDDIKLHPESLFRALRFMSFAHDDVSLGGHMLDIVRPNELYEAGAELDDGGLPQPVGQGTYLGHSAGLDLFLNDSPVDYNGWWFFMASKQTLREVGLPMPCFIRGDDMEFGIRLKRHGLQTVPVPGIAVWHEPFYMKLGNWQYYFEVRNRLLMEAMHKPFNARKVHLRIHEVFHRDAMLSRYNSCEFAIAAVRDYLSGPETAFDTTDRQLKSRLKEHKELGPTRVPEATRTVRRFGRYRRRATAWSIPLMRMLRLVSPKIEQRPAKTIGADGLVAWRPTVFNGYRLREPLTDVMWEFQRRPDVERRQFIEFNRVMLQLERHHFDESSVDMSQGIPWLGWWEKQFSSLPAQGE